jgi:hypothetical protein
MAAVRFQLEGSVGHIVLSNPPKNLVGSAFAVDLRSALQAASKSDIRVLLVRAEGPNFGAGGDVSDFLKMDFDSWRTFIADVNSAYRSIEALMIPTIAAVRGTAFKWGHPILRGDSCASENLGRRRRGTCGHTTAGHHYGIVRYGRRQANSHRPIRGAAKRHPDGRSHLSRQIGYRQPAGVSVGA